MVSTTKAVTKTKGNHVFSTMPSTTQTT